MEGNGISLFQKSELFKLNTTNPEEEEAEAIEEEKRRNAQLREMLSDAFDDLHIEDNDGSFASGAHTMNNTHDHGDCGEDVQPTKQQSRRPKTSNGSESLALSAHYQHCFHNNMSYLEQREPPVGAITGGTFDMRRNIGAGGDVEQLAELYGVRMREIARLQEQAAAKERDWLSGKENVEKRLIQLEAEKLAAQNSSSQAQELLVSSKEQIAQLLAQVENLKQKNKELEISNADLARDLGIARTEVDTLQAKVLVLERSSSQRVGELQADSMLRAVQERHRREVAGMQQQLDSMAAKLEATEISLRSSERRVWEVTRGHEAMLLERGEAVNRLARALEESQKHCQQLMAEKNNPSLAAALQDKQHLQTKVSKLEKELEQARMDIDQLETMVGLGALTGESTPVSNAKRAAFEDVERLREELARSLRNQEARRAECRKLNEELREREQELRDMRQQEGKYQQVVQNLKTESEKLLAQVQQSEIQQPGNEQTKKLAAEVSHLDQQNKELKSKVEELGQQNAKLAEHTVELQRICDEDKLRAIDEHTSEYLAFHQRTVATAREQERQQAEKNIQQVRHELELEREGNDKVKAAYVELARSKAVLAFQLEELRGKLEERQHSKEQTESNEELEERMRKEYEERITQEVQKAKQAVLVALESDKQYIPGKTTTEGPASKTEDSKPASSPSTELELHCEVNRLRTALTEQAERLKSERREAEEKAWTHFRAELQRVADHQKSVSCEDRATSPVQVSHDQALQAELEQTKSKHASRLAELQAHLRDKQQEMEDFKTKILEYTQQQDNNREQFVNTLKQEVESLTTELNENKKISDAERQKLVEEIHLLSSELQALKSEKNKEVASLRKKRASHQEAIAQLKDYYERREEFLQEKFRKHEEHCYDNRLKLKAALHSLSEIDFSLVYTSQERPTKDM